MSTNLSDISLLSIKSANYYCIISGISKYKNIWLRKAEHCETKKLLSHIKMSIEILTFGYIEIKKKIYH